MAAQKVRGVFVNRNDPFDSDPTWLTPEEQAEWHRTKSVLKANDFAGHLAYSSIWILRKLITKCWAELEGQDCVIAGQKGVRVPNPNVVLMSHLIYQLNRLVRQSGFARIDSNGGRGSAADVPAAAGDDLDSLINRINRRSGMNRDKIHPRKKVDA